MARNGSGTYSRPAGGTIVTGTTITKTWADTSLDDISTALTASIANDGQSPILANLPMGTYRHTGVGNGAARTDYSAVGQIQDGSLIWCGTATGTANALILTATPTITAVTAGMTLRFKASASANSGATTATIGSAAAINVQVNGAACSGAEIAANNWYQITVDAGLTTCQLTKLGRWTTTELGAAPAAGSTAIVTLGTVTAGTWNGSVIAPAYGGTGVANNAASTITISGNYASTFVVAGAYTYTLPSATSTLLATNGSAASLTSFPTFNQNTTGYASALKSATTTVDVASAAAPILGQVLTATSATTATWQTPATSGSTYLRKTANYTAVASDAILASTTAGAWTLTLPAAPNQFDRVGPIIDTDGTWQTNNLTIGRNGNNIMGIAENMTCQIKNGAFTLEYDSTTGWRIY